MKVDKNEEFAFLCIAFLASGKLEEAKKDMEKKLEEIKERDRMRRTEAWIFTNGNPYF